MLAATGYRVDIERLDLPDPGPRRAVIRRNAGGPRQSGGFESSVTGLYLTGLPAADPFGPLMRFVCGTGFAAWQIGRAIATAGRS